MTDWFVGHGYQISDAHPCLFISDRGDLAFAWVDDLIYVTNLVEEYGLEDGKTTGTPMQSNIKLVKSTEQESKAFKDKRAVGKLSQFLQNPNDTHWGAFKRVVRYLKGTQDWGILYQPKSGHEIVVYVDSSWAEDKQSLSTSGYSFQCGSGLVSSISIVMYWRKP